MNTSILSIYLNQKIQSRFYKIKFLAPNIINIFFTFIVMGFIFALPMMLLYNHTSFSTHMEESLGFRYFHSLRIIYGRETPWLPQGQLPGLFHFAIQKILTYMGHPIDEFFPRIDLFSIWAIVIPLLLATALYYWATKPIKSIFSHTIFIMLFLSIFYSSRNQDGWMLLPDYHIWIISLSLIGAGWAIRIMNGNNLHTSFTIKDAMLIGIYAGACLSVKITLITYPAIIGIVYIMIYRQTKTLARFLLVSIQIALLFWFLVIYFYYQGKLAVFFLHFLSLRNYLDSQVILLRDNFVEFIKSFYPSTLLDMFLFIPFMLIYCVNASFKNKDWINYVLLLMISIFELYMLYQRNYTHTYIEVQYFFFILSTVLAVKSYKDNILIQKFYSWITIKQSNNSTALRTVVFISLLIIPILNQICYSYPRINNFIKMMNDLNLAQQGIQDALSKNNGKTIFLIPINESVDEYNLHTIDNGLFKAATGLNPQWESNAYVARLYSNRWYARDKSTLPDLNLYSNIVFRTKNSETSEQALYRLRTHYKTEFQQFNCGEPYFKHILLNKESLIFCTKNIAIDKN